MARRPSGEGWGESGGGVPLGRARRRTVGRPSPARSDGPSPRPPGRPGCRRAPARASHNDLQGRWPEDGPACAWALVVPCRVVAEPPWAALCRRSASADVVASIVRPDCYRLERQLPGGVRTRGGMAPCHGAPEHPVIGPNKRRRSPTRISPGRRVLAGRGGFQRCGSAKRSAVVPALWQSQTLGLLHPLQSPVSVVLFVNPRDRVSRDGEHNGQIRPR